MQKILMISRPLLTAALVALSIPSAFAAPAAKTPNGKPWNVLFISVDDLNDWVGFLGGHPQAQTPNMDRLAAESMVFENAQCAAPVCNPSRTALMSGIQPFNSGIYGNQEDMRDSPVLKDAVMLPRHFSNHGYTSLARGKIFHKGTGEGADPQSWDILSHEKKDMFEVPKDQLTDMSPYKGLKIQGELAKDIGVPIAWRGLMTPKELTSDYQNAMWAGQWLTDQAGKETPQPFFLACGIFQPHLKWFIPAEHFARFDLDEIKLPPIKDDDLVGLPGQKPTKEYLSAVELGLREEVVWAYLAASSYADDCVGVILDALDKSPYRDNTIVVLWGDHGWHLGEKLRYKKGSLWEESARLPLVIKVPGMKPGRTKRPVSLIDLYPTLVDLAGIPAKEGLDGRSLVPLLKNPETDWDHPAITTANANNHTLRTERWRYISRANGAEELYDHDKDPQEWENLADDPRFKSVKAELRKFLPETSAPAISGKGKGKRSSDNED